MRTQHLRSYKNARQSVPNVSWDIRRRETHPGDFVERWKLLSTCICIRNGANGGNLCRYLSTYLPRIILNYPQKSGEAGYLSRNSDWQAQAQESCFDSLRGQAIFSFPQCPDRLWGPPSILSNRHLVLILTVNVAGCVKLTTHLHPLPRRRICGSILTLILWIHDVVLN
jgi:hypothetical protein